MDPNEDISDLENELAKLDLEIENESRTEEILNREYSINVIDVNKSAQPQDIDYDDPDLDIDDKITPRRVNK